LAASEGKLRHLGLPGAPPRSTLAYANEHRPWQMYQTMFDQLLQKCQTLAVSRTDQKRRFRFKNKLMSLDGTVIDLCASVFDWAQFRRTKGAVKLHIRRHIVSLPAWIEVHTLHSDRAAQKSPLILRLTNGLCYTNARRIV
jgi:hypothetical protein